MRCRSCEAILRAPVHRPATSHSTATKAFSQLERPPVLHCEELARLPKHGAGAIARLWNGRPLLLREPGVGASAICPAGSVREGSWLRWVVWMTWKSKFRPANRWKDPCC